LILSLSRTAHLSAGAYFLFAPYQARDLRYPLIHATVFSSPPNG